MKVAITSYQFAKCFEAPPCVQESDTGPSSAEKCAVIQTGYLKYDSPLIPPLRRTIYIVNSDQFNQ